MREMGEMRVTGKGRWGWGLGFASLGESFAEELLGITSFASKFFLQSLYLTVEKKSCFVAKSKHEICG